MSILMYLCSTDIDSTTLPTSVQHNENQIWQFKESKKLMFDVGINFESVQIEKSEDWQT